jgi:hypothetical protein
MSGNYELGIYELVIRVGIIEYLLDDSRKRNQRH